MRIAMIVQASPIGVLFVLFVALSVLVLLKLRSYSRRISRDISRNLTERRLLLDRIDTNMRTLREIGDGPVEIRETRRRDGLAIGIASDELRRHGLNREKRTRLIKSGAHIICPDFSEQEALLGYLTSES